jgi:hypothetical protein
MWYRVLWWAMEATEYYQLELELQALEINANLCT